MLNSKFYYIKRDTYKIYKKIHNYKTNEFFVSLRSQIVIFGCQYVTMNHKTNTE